MIKSKTKTQIIDGVYKITLETFFDERGKIINLFDSDIITSFKQEKLTVSNKNILRGFHGDPYNDKLIYCLNGTMKLAIVNYDKKSSNFLQNCIIDMNEDSNFAVFVPKNYLNAHYCLSEKVFFYYKWSHGYIEPSEQYSVRWDSPKLNIKWNLENEPVLSERDKKSLFLE